MDHSSTHPFPVDQKCIRPSHNLPSPVVSIPERHRSSRWRRALTWIVIIPAIVYVGYRCGLKIPVRQEKPPPSQTVSVDGVVEETEASQTQDEELQAAVATEADATFWRSPIFFDRTAIHPTDPSCIVEWDARSRELSLIPTPLGERRFHATSNFTLRQDVHTYVFDSEIYMNAPSVQLHVVPNSEDHATVSVDAFYDDPATLDTFYACTYHADETEELLSQQRMFINIGGNTTTESIDLDSSNLQKSDVLRLHRRETKESEREAEANVWFNITLSVPSGKRKYSLRSDGFDVELHAGLVLNDASVNGGRIVAQENFVSRALNMHSRSSGKDDGIFGHFSSNGNVSITTVYAPIDAHVDITHSLDCTKQTVFLSSYSSPLTATLSLFDPSRKTGRNSFKVDAVSHESPLDLTICDESSYATVTIDAEARDGPARLSLDTTFEGTFIAKTMDSEASESASVSYTYAEWYPGFERMFQKPLKTRHIHAGAVGWGSEMAALSASSYAEVRSIGHSAHIDL